MQPDLLPCVSKIIDQVEGLTGKRIEFIPRKDLQVYATVKAARKGMPTHIMFYGPDRPDLLNHVVAHECGHVLRMCATPEADRLIPQSDSEARTRAFADMRPATKALASRLPAVKIDQILDMWHQGTVRQLTNYPSDIMIEKWIYDGFPELRPSQSNCLEMQYKDAVLGLSPQVASATPPKVYSASNAMNYAFFHMLSVNLNDERYVRQYRKSPHAQTGQKLITVREEAPDSYEGDIGTVNKWAEVLGVVGWFKWTGFENVPADYGRAF